MGSDWYAGALLAKSLPGPTVEFSPLFIPRDYDLSRASTLTAVLEPTANQGASVFVVKFRFQQTTISADGTHTDTTFNTIFTSPADWVKTLYWPVENPFTALPFWEAGLLTGVRTLGFRLGRRGQDVEDTYPGDIRLGLTLELDYPLRCQYGCF